MLKWSLRLLVLLLLLAAGLYFFKVEFGDGRMVVEPRPEAQKKQVGDKVKQLVPDGSRKQPMPPKQQAPKRKPQEKISNKERDALESILEEEL